MLNWFRSKKSAGSMTLAEAEHILDVVSVALQDAESPYSRISLLQGYDVFQVDTALKLRIANDFLILAATGSELELEARAKQWESIPLHVTTQFVPDAELDKFKRLPPNSREYHAARIAMMPSPVDEKGFTDPHMASLELLSSFATFCEHVGAADPIYWQKIYTRIGLPYDGGCPRGNEPTL